MPQLRNLRPYVSIGVVWAVLMAAAVGSGFVSKHEAGTLPPTDRGLDTVLFVQTSAEYRACCLQAYALAEERVKAKLAARSKGEKPATVVLDLDETVIDNSVFQARQVQARRARFDEKQWDEWERDDHGQVRFVPGAKEFLAFLKAQKVEAVYITNRSETHRKGLHRLLKRLEIDVPDDQLLLYDTEAKVSDKTGRREKAAEMFDVLLLVGDNLRDFDQAFKYDEKQGVDGRKEAVDEQKERFGTDWIILPNPLYGEWTKGFANTPADVDLLKK
jgi:acid phosphatase